MTRYRVRREDVYPGGDDTIELEEAETVVDVTWRGGNRAIFAILTPAEDTQCQWTLDSGEQCGRDATNGEYCWQHTPEE